MDAMRGRNMNNYTFRTEVLIFGGAPDATSDLLKMMLNRKDGGPSMSLGNLLGNQLAIPFDNTATPFGCSMVCWCQGDGQKTLLDMCLRLSRMGVPLGHEFKCEWMGWRLSDKGHLMHDCGFDFDPDDDASSSDYNAASITMNQERVEEMVGIFRRFLVHESIKYDPSVAFICAVSKDADYADEKVREAVKLLNLEV